MELKLDEMKLEIEELTRIGHDHLANESSREAAEVFHEAFQISKQVNDPHINRGCRFNLGACFVAIGNPSLGLRYLEEAIPPEHLDDGHENFADLWYNIGVAQHALNDIDEAISAYKKANATYKEMMIDHRLEAECLSKLAVCYHLKNDLSTSRDCYEKAQVGPVLKRPMGFSNLPLPLTSRRM